MWQMGERNPTDNANRWLFPALPLPFPLPSPYLATVPSVCFSSVLFRLLAWVRFGLGRFSFRPCLVISWTMWSSFSCCCGNPRQSMQGRGERVARRYWTRIFALAFPHEIILIGADLLTCCSPTTTTNKAKSNRYIKSLGIGRECDRLQHTLQVAEQSD